MFSYWLSHSSTLVNLAMLGRKVQEVMWLRSQRLARGDALARRELNKAVAEKVAAAGDAFFCIWSGKSPDKAIGVYRRVVRANRRRLTRRRSSA